MKVRMTKWSGIGVLAIMVGALVGVFGFAMAGGANAAVAVMAHSNTPQVVTAPAGTGYALQTSILGSVDGCTVTDPGGADVRVNVTGGKPNDDVTWTDIARFRTTVAGDYAVTCTAKVDGREVRVVRDPSFQDMVRQPVFVVGAVIVIAGVALAIAGRPRKAAPG